MLNFSAYAQSALSYRLISPLRMKEYHFNILHALHFVDGDIIDISVIDGRFVQSLDLDSGLHSKNRPY